MLKGCAQEILAHYQYCKKQFWSVMISTKKKIEMSSNIIRITVVGDGDTGKHVCSLCIKTKDLMTDTSLQLEFHSIRFDVYSMNIPINAIEYKIILSDTAGQEEFDKLRRLAYKDVTTKSDLRTNSHRHVRTEEGEKLARDIGANGFIENSSKTQRNIDATFQMAILAAISKENFLKKKRRSDCWFL
ncbi:hypothetical protein NQ314_016580 [Rhamnusium bicolor]|uniref:Uncharacterized protein n=1 Tax=Rhamnusium bicolor TaxID=1586634 RepID=A0AAV8WVL9_9CUCU|nr:hypothetical protein NQ314_016580 [Rhamnusium bicolor]